MANINLLPWREWERERKRKEFFVNLAGVVLLAVILVLGFGQYLDGSVETQNARNTYYSDRIFTLDQKIAQISTLKQDRAELLDRMRVIQQLQGNRPVIVRIFDELVRTLAKGVHYETLSMQNNSLSVKGQAESNNRISALMRNIDGSDWFSNPNLRSIKEDPDNSAYGDGASTFDLTFAQVNPAEAAEEEGAQ